MSVGTSIRRFDCYGKVMGTTLFGGDLSGPDVATVVVIRSPHPHARIEALRCDNARAIPGVLAVFTADDIDGTNLHGLIHRDQEVFARTRVRFMGDALGIIVAETPKVASAALKAITVDYTPLPILSTMDEALAPHAHAIHAAGNVLSTELIRKGDAETALKSCDAIVECDFHTHGVDHAFLDLEAGMAFLDGDVVTIHAAGQWIHEERRLVALALGLPLERVRIIQPPTGGAFGGREDLSIQIYLGLAALKLKRPVRIQYTREESMIARHKRHPIRIRYTMGAMADGTLVVAKVHIYSDEGAYASTGPAVLRKAVSHCTGPYRVPHIWADGTAVFTNNNPTGAMRGFGACQLAIAYEGAAYQLAKKLGIDIVEFKRKNLLRDGDDITTKQVIPVAGARDCMEAALSRMNWDRRSYHTPAPHLRRGYGISTICFGLGYGDGFPDVSRARVRFGDDDVLEVYSGGVEVGQGLHSLMAQIAGTELGVDPSQVRVIASDTQTTPESGSSSATRQTVFTGNAIRMAAAELAKEVLDIAAMYLRLHWDELELRHHQVVGKRDTAICAPLVNLVRYGRERGYKLDSYAVYRAGTVTPHRESGLSPRAFVTYMFGSHIAEVLVDIETGEVTVERLIAAHDVGKALNPQQVEGQIEGGVAQGIGMALMEEVVTREGKILNASFTDYIIPTIRDVPLIESIIVERADPEGPYGARGVGEPPLIGTPPAILAAISDAIGCPVMETPATAERVWHRIQTR